MKSTNTQSGFSLMEILVSVAVLAMSSILITQIFFTTTRINTKATLVQDVKQNGDFALDEISRFVRTGTKLATSACNADNTANELVVTTLDNQTVTYACQSDGTSARIASESASGDMQYLTGNIETLSASGGTDCTDSTLRFSCQADPAPDQQSVTITFTLQQLGKDISAFQTAKTDFQSSVSLRK